MISISLSCKHLLEEVLVEPSLVVVEVVLVGLHHQVEQNQARDDDRQHLKWVNVRSEVACMYNRLHLEHRKLRGVHLKGAGE